MTVKSQTYQELSNKLDDLIMKLEDSETSIDEALELYKQAQNLIITLKNYLEKSQNEIKVISKHQITKDA